MEVKEEPEKQPQKKQLPKEEHLQELNLCEILKDCPRGEMFWSPVFGDVKLCEINYNEKEISVRLKTGKTCWINSDATLTYSGIKSEESMLYPSREQRDWTKVKYEKKKELPKTWEEFCKNYAIKDGECYMDDCCDLIDADCEGHTRDAQSDRNILPSNVAAKTHLALMQLHQLRDCYRDGWLPNGISAVHGIERYYDPSNGVVKLRVIKLYCPSKFLSFQTEERAKEFFNNFRELIEQADDLI